MPGVEDVASLRRKIVKDKKFEMRLENLEHALYALDIRGKQYPIVFPSPRCILFRKGST